MLSEDALSIDTSSNDVRVDGQGSTAGKPTCTVHKRAEST
jgi:hypothetical protein